MTAVFMFHMEPVVNHRVRDVLLLNNAKIEKTQRHRYYRLVTCQNIRFPI